MKYSKLGSSNIDVSRVCLGSMTWGVQNNQQDADEQIYYALEQGINFIDTAEMYAVPPSKETYGKTERIIGHWLAANPSRRNQLTIASKVAGPGLNWVRNGSQISGKTVEQAVEGSLKRLQVEHIDLYQLHWPNRATPHFGRHFPGQIHLNQVNKQQQTDQMLDILQGLDRCVKAGKISHCGLSDDTPWGINTYLSLSKEYNLPQMVSIQNEFSLLHSKDWPYLIENCIHQNIAYLPWSPLATGLLSGKYRNGVIPANSRQSLTQRHGNFRTTQLSEQAVEAYCEIARSYNFTPAQLALAWCDNVEGVTSTIIGATTIEQLKEDISAFAMPIPKTMHEEISQVLKQFPVPF